MNPSPRSSSALFCGSLRFWAWLSKNLSKSHLIGNLIIRKGKLFKSDLNCSERHCLKGQVPDIVVIPRSPLISPHPVTSEATPKFRHIALSRENICMYDTDMGKCWNTKSQRTDHPRTLKSPLNQPQPYILLVQAHIMERIFPRRRPPQ